MTNAYKIAIVGPKDIILGFKAIGVQPFFPPQPRQRLNTFKHSKAKNWKEKTFHAMPLFSFLNHTPN